MIDIRLFGSAMAVEGFLKHIREQCRLPGGILCILWSLSNQQHYSIMNDDSSTFGKKYKLHYGHFVHYGTVNKYAAQLTGMTDADHELFCKALVQSMHANQTDSKQGQIPQYYLEIVYKPEFDGYLGDLRRFVTIKDATENVRRWTDIKVDFSDLDAKIKTMHDKGFVEEVRAWVHPSVDTAQMINFPEHQPIELLEAIHQEG